MTTPTTTAKSAEEFLQAHLGGNMNIATLTPFALQEMLVVFAQQERERAVRITLNEVGDVVTQFGYEEDSSAERLNFHPLP